MAVERAYKLPTVQETIRGLASKSTLSRKDMGVFHELFDHAAGGVRGRFRSAVTIEEWLMLHKLAHQKGMGMLTRKFGHPIADGYSDMEYSLPAA